MTSSLLSKTEYADTRASGVKILKTVLKKEQNIRIIEKSIHKVSQKMDSYEESYQKIIYQVVGDIINDLKLKDIVTNIKKKMVKWNHPTFSDVKNRIEEHDEFIINPFEVEEGVTVCKSCGSGRVFTYQKMCRSADEPMSTFCTCCECKKQWTYSG